MEKTMKEKIQQSIEQRISQWKEDDIYAVSLYVFDEEDDPCRPVAVLGYNTERQVQKSTPEATNEQEARWNYAFWLQNEEMCWGRGDTAEDIKEWVTEQDLWDREDEITPQFVELLVAIVQDIHASELLKDKFGREIPILIHELEYYEKIAQQNIEANGEALDRDFVAFCMPGMQEEQDEPQVSQNEMQGAEKRIVAPQSKVFHGDSAIVKQSTDMRKVAVLIIAIILIMSLFWVLGLILSGRSNEVHEDTSQQAESFTEESEELTASEPLEGEENTSMSSEPKEAESNQIHWQVYIQPDMPEAFKEVLRQFEEFFNVFVQDQSFENEVDLTDSEWGYMFEELCGGWRRRLTYDGEKTAEEYLRYSLTDLTGDGFPELIMGYYLDDYSRTFPKAVFYCNETEGIKMRYVTSYYDMELYEVGIIEYISGGVNYTVDYDQYQEDIKEWICIDSFLVEMVIDGEDVPNGVNYYRQEDGGDYVYGNLAYKQISEEEYERISDKYTQKPVEMDWISLILTSESVITETEIVEKNAKNTGELRISTSITKLWLNEDEEGAEEINAALREIYEAAEAEMEAYNQGILDEYLFENGVLQEDLDEWLLYPLDEWLAISQENYVASIEYVDENYLCLSMNGDNFVAGGAHGSYWSDYYVFDRHTGQRLSLEDFVNDSTEEIKEIVKAHILAVAPYSKGEQSENALEQNRFFLTAEGLGINYDDYEIGDYASGSCDIIIPFELFDMKEDMWPGRTTK